MNEKKERSNIYKYQIKMIMEDYNMDEDEATIILDKHIKKNPCYLEGYDHE